jgi:hypothetical protein
MPAQLDPPSDDVVVFRPDRRRLLILTPFLFLMVFGGLTLVQQWLHTDYLRPTGDRLAASAAFTAMNQATFWFNYYRRRWLIRVSSLGLDLALYTGEQVHVPWSDVKSVRIQHRAGVSWFEVGCYSDDLVGRTTAGWRRVSVLERRTRGPGRVGVQLGPLRPGFFRLGLELAHRLPESGTRTLDR